MVSVYNDGFKEVVFEYVIIWNSGKRRKYNVNFSSHQASDLSRGDMHHSNSTISAVEDRCILYNFAKNYSSENISSAILGLSGQ